MDIGIVAVRYAKALYAFAEENNEEEKVSKELLTLIDSFLKVEALQPALLNPVLTAQQKENLLLVACGGKDISTTMKRFVSLVNEKKRASLMLFIAHSYIKLYREKMNLVVGKLILPTAVSEALKEKLQKLIEAKVNCKMDFQVEEDPEIGGGFILEYDTYRLDASLRTQLKQILKELK